MEWYALFWGYAHVFVDKSERQNAGVTMATKALILSHVQYFTMVMSHELVLKYTQLDEKIK